MQSGVLTMSRESEDNTGIGVTRVPLEDPVRSFSGGVRGNVSDDDNFDRGQFSKGGENRGVREIPVALAEERSRICSLSFCLEILAIYVRWL